MKAVTKFRRACRENTGAHFLDSGAAYGRHHERPPIPKDTPLVTLGKYGPQIDTGALLAEYLEPDKKLQARFMRWANKPENTDLNWFEAGAKFGQEVLGLECVARDNTYNGENDLSQIYVFEVWQESLLDCDWMYNGNAIVAIYIHTGCDVRGGYTKPIFCRPTMDYDVVIPFDLCAGYYVVAAHNPDGQECDPQDVPNADHYQIGYSNNPGYKLERDTKRVFGYTRKEKEASICVLLENGYRIKVVAYAN